MATEWTIATLKERMETRFEHLNELQALRDKALDLQAIENNRRLNELNHEHARVALAQQTYVSKDTWDGYIKSDLMWKGTADRSMQAGVTRAEFQAYKDTTEKALTLKAGQSQGIGMTTSAIVQLFATLAAAVTIVSVFLLRH